MDKPRIFLGLLASALVACAPREDASVARVDAAELAQDNQALDQLRFVGSNLAKPHQIEFYLYVPSEADARAAEASLRTMGYGVTVSAGANESNWLCLASKTTVPTIQALTDARVVFKRLALTYRGAYDGWRATIER